MLNDEAIPPPSPPRRQRRRGWTQATIAGSAKRAIGILHNPLYIGRIVWNRHQKMLDPDTGKRIMRLRPRSEWQWAEAPDLRIVPHELWEAVQARRKGRKPVDWSMVPGHRPSALLSGILLCAECGSRYVLNNRRYYGCAAHRDRGPAICANSKLARRDRVEEGLVRIILQELFSPEVMAYVTHRVNWALARMMETPDENRRRRGRELDEAQRELDNIVAAIRQGVVTPTTKALLEECERRVAAGEAALRDSPPAPAPIAALPRVVEGYLTQLRTTLATDTDAARGLISKLVGTVPLKRVGDRLIGEVRGNLSGLLDLAVANDGSGGWI